MAKLIYSAIASLDGYVADEDGNFDWAAPDEEVHTFANDLARSVGTYLYGRRIYQVMDVWETDHTLADQSPVMRDFAQIWQAADKIVYSKTLETVSTTRTRIERDFDPEAAGGIGLGDALLNRLDDLLSEVQRVCTHRLAIPGAPSSQSAVRSRTSAKWDSANFAGTAF
jgi:hypothetical protein